MSPISPPTEALRRALREELPGALVELRARFPDESFYALALSTTPRHDSIALVGASEESLEASGVDDPWDPRAWTRCLRDLRPLDASLDALDTLHIEARGLCPDLSETWLDLLAQLQASGYLASFGHPTLTLVGLPNLDPEQAAREVEARAEARARMDRYS